MDAALILLNIYISFIILISETIVNNGSIHSLFAIVCTCQSLEAESVIVSK